MTEKEVKFFQVAANEFGVFGLDSEGRIWYLSHPSISGAPLEWVKVPNPVTEVPEPLF